MNIPRQWLGEQAGTLAGRYDFDPTNGYQQIKGDLSRMSFLAKNGIPDMGTKEHDAWHKSLMRVLAYGAFEWLIREGTR